MAAKKTAKLKKRQKELVLKALTNPAFKRMLTKEPQKALGKKITATMQKEIAMLLAVIKGIESQISAIADELLCANGGPCGIA
jgi:triosephosphate isomerase